MNSHPEEWVKLSNDSLVTEKVCDIVGLCLNPRESAVALSVDEESQVQALARSQPAFPMMPAVPEGPTHDYVRHGTSLFAALSVKDGTVTSSVHRTHPSAEFKKFLTRITRQFPATSTSTSCAAPYSTHKHPTIKARLDKHPRFPPALHADLFLMNQPGRADLRRSGP